MAFEEIFRFKKFLPEKLIAYGFESAGGAYYLRAPLLGGQFILLVKIDGGIFTDLTDAETGEKFLPFYVDSAEGAFVGEVKSAARALLQDVAENCCVAQIFKQRQTSALLAYAQSAFATPPEYLWEKFPDNAVLRRADSKKWYAAILTTDGAKFFKEGRVEVVDLRASPTQIAALTKGERYFDGYHMNKKHWYTIVLDGSVCDEELFERLAVSYALAIK